MLIQQGFFPARTIVFEGALGFVTAESGTIGIRLLGGAIALDALPMPIEIDEIAQRCLHQPPSAEHIALPPAQRGMLLPKECGALSPKE